MLIMGINGQRIYRKINFYCKPTCEISSNVWILNSTNFIFLKQRICKNATWFWQTIKNGFFIFDVLEVLEVVYLAGILVGITYTVWSLHFLVSKNFEHFTRVKPETPSVSDHL